MRKNLKRRFGAVLCSLSFTIASASPVFAGTGDSSKADTGKEETNKTDASKTDASTSTSTTSSARSGSSAAEPAAAPVLANTKVTALLNVLVTKGVLAPAEAAEIRSAAPEAEFQMLVEALSRKGVLTANDLNAAAQPSATPAASATMTNVAAQPSYPSYASEAESSADPADPDPRRLPSDAQAAKAATGPTVVAAVAPVRVLPVDPPKKDGLVPAFKAGAVKITPYGFLKASLTHDSSSPNGDDFPFVGLFLSSTNALSTGPTNDPEVHLKARSTRIGANFEWPDISPKLTFTGKVEGDYEGNFSEVDNRDVSSIRSNAFQLRQAWARMDYAATESTDLFFEGGQDWTIFGSTVLPNIFETTFLGAYYGVLYERSPQFRFGVTQTLSESHKVKFSPEFALMMPSSGQIEKLGSLGLEGQIGQGEREGADADRPEFESRAVLQWQLDNAPGVAPAQVFWAGFYSRRESIVTSDAVLTPVTAASPALVEAYATAFPAGFTASSKQYGDQVGFSLPTRWATLVATGYFGGDLRFFFGGQVNSYFTDTGGLTNPLTYNTLDGGPLAAAGGAILATNSSGQVVVAPQRPIRSFGGFINLGLPISRWFNADPKGHNAGWQAYLQFGKDQVVSKDLANQVANANGELPLRMGKMAAFTLYYKFNPWCSFGFEQSIYATRLNANTGAAYTIAGVPSNEWQDHRTEFGPIFTF